MKTNKVTVLPYDSAWAEAFLEISREVKAALGDLPMAIHHVGSTSVPGMSAKPIIDLDVEIRSMDDFSMVKARLAAIGYEHEGDLGIGGREAFCYNGKPALQKHHLYVCPSDSPELYRHLTFRNYLRGHPAAVAEYSRIKEEAALAFPDSIEDYMNCKAPCIEKLYRQCGL